MDDVEATKTINLSSNPTASPNLGDPNRLLWFASALILICVLYLVWACTVYVRSGSTGPAKEVFELAKTTIPPLITLILGFYFGGRHNQ